MNNSAMSAFISKIQVAKNHNSKELRLTIDEADELNAEFSHMMIRVIELSQKVIDFQAQLMSAEVKQDGGGF